ncbi:hypothetical protein [Neolewinella persica]|uniref:hypothetical protein n=1 Tax=Neolewinella persica TaxID=70998 RepID=UPI00037B65E0|nr:hypothetical protein [Neolewinella persica]
MTSTIHLTTPYGPAGFLVTFTERGEIVNVESAAAKLPETVFRLTHGDNWEAVRNYFEDLTNYLRYPLEFIVWKRKKFPGYQNLQEAFSLHRPGALNEEGPLPPWRLRAEFWQKRNTNEQKLLLLLAQNPKNELTLLARKTIADKHFGPDNATVLEPWLQALIPLLDGETLLPAFELLGNLHTDSAREYVFSQLELPGRHIAAKGLLKGLSTYHDEASKQRFLALYPSLSGHRDLLELYLEMLLKYRGDDVVNLTLQVLEDHPEQALEVYRLLSANDVPNPVAHLIKQFNKEGNYFVLDLLLGVINRFAAPGSGISLADMNEKVASEHFTDTAQVTWPQLLEKNWLKLVVETSQQHALKTIENYLKRTEPRLQRNALLQLKAIVKSANLPPALPLGIELRLGELVDSRFDKISTVAIDIIGEQIDSLADPAAMVDILVRHSLHSRYRLMNVAALKKAARQPALGAQQEAFFLRSIKTAEDRPTLDNIERILPYFRFLGVEETLKEAISTRRAEVNA